MSLTAQLAAAVHVYREQAVKAAELEAAHKRAQAKRFLVAMHRSEGGEAEAKSAAMAEKIAEADDQVADLYSQRLIAAALADATKQKLMSLREEIGMARSQMANEREMDRIHSTDRQAT